MKSSEPRCQYEGISLMFFISYTPSPLSPATPSSPWESRYSCEIMICSSVICTALTHRLSGSRWEWRNARSSVRISAGNRTIEQHLSSVKKFYFRFFQVQSIVLPWSTKQLMVYLLINCVFILKTLTRQNMIWLCRAVCVCIDRDCLLCKYYSK